ncbi:MAG: ATP-binding protein [Armatimonadota bacterium]
MRFFFEFLYLTILYLLVLGGFACFKTPRRSPIRHFRWLVLLIPCWAASCWFIRLPYYGIRNTGMADKVLVLISLLLGLCLLGITISLPAISRYVKWFAGLLAVVGIAWGVLLGTTQISSQTFSSLEGVLDPGPFFPLYSGWLLLCGCTLIAALGYLAFSRRGRERLSYRYLLIGVCFLLVGFFVEFFFRVASVKMSTPFFGVITYASAAAILTLALIDDTLSGLHRTLRPFIVYGGGVSIDLLLVMNYGSLFNLFLMHALDLHQVYSRLAFILIIGLSFYPLCWLIGYIVDRTFFRHTLDYRTALRDEGDTLVKACDHQALIQAVSALLSRTMLPVSLAIYLPDAQGNFIRTALAETVLKVGVAGSRRMFRDWQGGFSQVYRDIHRRKSNAASRETDPRGGGDYFQNSFSTATDRLPAMLVGNDPLIHYAHGQDTPLLTESLLLRPDADHRIGEILRGWGACAGIPLMISDRLQGLILLGERASGDAYTREDAQFLQVIGTQAALALDNISHYEALKRMNAELESRVLARTQELAHANAQLQEADRAKDQFLATITHELLNPLTGILTWTEVAQLMPEKAPEAIDHIQENCQRQKRLIDDLLDISRLIHQKLRLHLQEIDCWQTTVQSLDDLRRQAIERNVILLLQAPDGPLPITADPMRIHQVVTNLVGNALKFTETGGTITVTGRHANGYAVLSVTDTGIGIPPEKLAAVFDLFMQGETGNLNGGLGLGLPLVRGIVELHHGTVTAESAGADQGSTFTITLPLVTRTEEDASTGDEADGREMVPA